MNDWKESTWFKNWLNMARQGQPVARSSAEICGDATPGDRLTLHYGECVKTDHSAEMQVTE
jgi:hypothetical protein